MKEITQLRKFLVIIALVIATIISLPKISNAAIDTVAETAIIVDVNTGKILYAKSENEPLPPASMTKMMTEYIVFDQIDKNELSWDKKTEISDYVFDISANNNFSGIGLRKNIDYTVKDLYEAMAINSDNATTIALAELISETEGEFVKLMNETGEKMGLPDFQFVNSTGLDNDSNGVIAPEGTSPDDSNLLSAKSAALLAYHIVTDYPEALEISKIPEKKFEDQMIRNYNWMLPHETSHLDQFFYEGVDGLKTGNTSLAGYTFTGTAEKDGRRLITVVMKAESEAVRFKETAKLLDYGFNEFKEVELFPKGYQLEDESILDVAKGKQETVEFALEESISSLIKNNTEENYQIEYEIDDDLLNEDGEIVAPIEKGTVIGKANLINDGDNNYGYIVEGEEKTTVNLVTTEEIEKKNWFSAMLDSIGGFFKNLFNGIVGIFK